MREVELWNRAMREEEKAAIQKYAAEHGEEQMRNIQESIKERQEKEAKSREALQTAKPSFDKYLATAMQKRNDEWEAKKKEFLIKKMNEIKEAVLKVAKQEFMIEENKKI